MAIRARLLERRLRKMTNSSLHRMDNMVMSTRGVNICKEVTPLVEVHQMWAWCFFCNGFMIDHSMVMKTSLEGFILVGGKEIRL